MSTASGAASEDVERWLAEFVAAETAPDRLQVWVDRTVEAILGESPEVAENAVLATLLRTSVRAHWMAFLTELTEPAREVRLVRPAVEFAGALAQHQLPLATLFDVYRIAQQSTWTYLTEVVRGLADSSVDGTEVLVFAWSRASAWIDASITASVDVFAAEREKVEQGAAAQLLDEVRRALDGTVGDVRELSARLGGYPVSAHHTGFVLRTDDDDAVSGLAATAHELAGALGSRQPLVVRPGGRELWCWAGTRDRPDLRVLADLEPALADRGIGAYVGTPGAGLDGFALTHREAQAAQRIALQAGRSADLVVFPDVELLALLNQSPAAARRFAERTLGDLAADDDAAGRLRRTLAAVLDEGSVDAAARRLSVHKNTVRYRLSQVEDTLGRPISGESVELALALRYHATFLEPD